MQLSAKGNNYAAPDCDTIATAIFLFFTCMVIFFITKLLIFKKEKLQRFDRKGKFKLSPQEKRRGPRFKVSSEGLLPEIGITKCVTSHSTKIHNIMVSTKVKTLANIL